MSSCGFSIHRRLFPLIFGVLISFFCMGSCVRPAFAEVVPLGYTLQGYLGSSSNFSNNMNITFESVGLVADFPAVGDADTKSLGVFPAFSPLPDYATFFGVGMVSDTPIVNPGETLVAQPVKTVYALTPQVDYIKVSGYGGAGGDIRYFAQYSPGGSWTSVTPDDDGGFTPSSRPIFGFAYTVRISSSRVNLIGVKSFVLADSPTFYRLTNGSSEIIGTINQQTDDISTSMDEQTEKLVSTEGSDSVLDGALSGGEDGLLDRLGFVGTVIQVPVKIFEGLTSADDSSIDFPGVSVALPGGNFEIPAYSLDLWENFPALETPVRTGCTFVVVLLWLRGCKSIYERIVHGSTMVETE